VERSGTPEAQRVSQEAEGSQWTRTDSPRRVRTEGYSEQRAAVDSDSRSSERSDKTTFVNPSAEQEGLDSNAE
jgi:hypothetical protein